MWERACGHLHAISNVQTRGHLSLGHYLLPLWVPANKSDYQRWGQRFLLTVIINWSNYSLDIILLHHLKSFVFLWWAFDLYNVIWIWIISASLVNGDQYMIRGPAFTIKTKRKEEENLDPFVLCLNEQCLYCSIWHSDKGSSPLWHKELNSMSITN